MTKEVDRYTYRVTWSEDDSEYVGLCAELPSLSWLEKSPEKALLGIRKLVNETVTDLKRGKEPVPEPISTRSYSGKFRFAFHDMSEDDLRAIYRFTRHLGPAG